MTMTIFRDGRYRQNNLISGTIRVSSLVSLMMYIPGELPYCH